MSSVSPRESASEEVNEYGPLKGPTLAGSVLQQSQGARLTSARVTTLEWTAKSDLREARLLRLPAVEARVGLAKTAIYGLIKQGKFPRPIKLGAASVWVDAEITNWMGALVARRDADLPA